MITRRHWLGSAAASLIGQARAQDAAAQRPNVLIFLADDLGWNDVGYHGNEIRTPNIDRLAIGGLRLERFHAFPLCSPTRAGLLTGRHPIRYGLAYSVVRPWSHYGLSTAETTIADVFRGAGYQTAITGKWHLGHTHRKLLPQARGFDHFYGHLNGAIDYYSHQRGGALDWQRNGLSVNEAGYTTDLLAEEASRWIRERDRKRPFFLYVPWNAPHSPLQAPEELVQRYAHIRDERRRTYAAMVEAMDRGMGMVLKTLEAEELLQNTLILFLSDNGGPRGQGASNGSLRAGKATVYEGGLRVPAVLHWSGRIPPGITDQVATVLDVLPTLAAAVGIDAQTKQPLDGVNLWPALFERRNVEREELFFAVQGDAGPKQHAVRLGEWKLVRIGDRESLFQISTDPEETADVIAQHAERASDLRARMNRWIRLHPPAEVITSQHAHPGWVPPADWAKAAIE